jgi:hypothetical protein
MENLGPAIFDPDLFNSFHRKRLSDVEESAHDKTPQK